METATYTLDRQVPITGRDLTFEVGGREALVLERVSDAFVALDREWHYTYVNRKAAEIFGRRPEDMVGRHIWTEFPEGVGQPFYHAYHRSLASQQFTFIEAYYEPYGRWFENRIYPSPDGLSIFFHDITDRKRAEALLIGQKEVLERIARGAELAESLAALLCFVEKHTPGMRASILLLDPKTRRLRHGAAPSLPRAYVESIDGSQIGPSAGSCGTAAYWARPVMVQDIATDPLWKDYRELALPHDLRACWSTPIFSEQREVLGTFAMYYAEPALPMERDQQLIAMVTNVAAIAIAQDRANTALRQSESRYRRLVESNLLGVMIAGMDGTIRESNDELLRILGRSRAELASGALRWDELTPEPARSADVQLKEHLLREGVCPPYEKALVHRDGHHVPVMVTATLLEGGQDCVVLVEDITERKEQEKTRYRNAELEERNRLAQEANRLKSEFLANMSHELRTPLNAIIGFSQFLRDERPGPLNAKQREYLDDVLSSGQHLLQLINDVLDLAKVEAGKLELHPLEFRLGAAVEEACSVVRAIAEAKQIALSCEIEAGLDKVCLDPQRLKQVLFNLLGNAVKFTEQGGRVDVTARRFDMSRLEVRVKDTGVGIRREDIPKLFQEFRQLDSGAGRQHEGTGLGLALTKRILESQGGTIGVESEPGRGSEFFFVLPTSFA